MIYEDGDWKIENLADLTMMCEACCQYRFNDKLEKCQRCKDMVCKDCMSHYCTQNIE
jgi:hypothetical protein